MYRLIKYISRDFYQTIPKHLYHEIWLVYFYILLLYVKKFVRTNKQLEQLRQFLFRNLLRNKHINELSLFFELDKLVHTDNSLTGRCVKVSNVTYYTNYFQLFIVLQSKLKAMTIPQVIASKHRIPF